MKQITYSYIEVRQEDSDEVHFIGFDRASGGYPYLKSGTPEFGNTDSMEKYFQSIVQAIGTYTEMSGGSKSIHYDIRILGELSHARTSATVKVRLFNVVSFSDGIKTELSKSITIFMREGRGYEERHLTESKIINQSHGLISGA